MPNKWTGRDLGGYRITEPIGRGNMAEVYQALQPSVDRIVAVKIMAAALVEDPQFELRFRQEARIVAALEHPHILPVIDFGEHERTLYLVTRYVNGGTLHDVIKQGPLDPEQALTYLTDIGAALDYAHGLGVVHRDVKPKNVLLDSQGNPFVADFGLAKMTAGGGLTRSGIGMIGTPHYMSPEQGSGQNVDGRSDLYALGIVLYEMLTGSVPFDADSAVGIVMKHIREPVPKLTDANPQLPRALDAVLERALAKAPDDRFQSAEELVEAVSEALAESAPPAQLSLGAFVDHARQRLRAGRERLAAGPLRKLFRDRRWQAAALGGGALLLAVMGYGLFGSQPGAPTPEPTAVPTSTAPATATRAAPPTSTPQLASTPTPAPPTETAPAETRLVWDTDDMTIVYIPAGEFLLGASDKNTAAEEDEKPQIAVYLASFWIDRTEVTVAQFQDFVNATGYTTDAERGCCNGDFARVGGVVFAPDPVFVKSATWKLPEGSGAPGATARQPVVQVSWSDAKAYCEWAGRRLPTEAEWEKAARGTEAWIYPWGDEFDPARLNFCDRRCGAAWRNTSVDDTFPRTGTVGVFPAGASPYDVMDMAGNVWEWVNDWYDFRGYFRFPTANPPGVETGTARVTRGGSWIDSASSVRTTDRQDRLPDERNNVTGFRCALSAIP